MPVDFDGCWVISKVHALQKHKIHFDALNRYGESSSPSPPTIRNRTAFIVGVSHAVWSLFSVFQVISIRRRNCCGFRQFYANLSILKRKKEVQKPWRQSESNQRSFLYHFLACTHTCYKNFQPFSPNCISNFFFLSLGLSRSYFSCLFPGFSGQEHTPVTVC